jgi:hypothetical protein
MAAARSKPAHRRSVRNQVMKKGRNIVSALFQVTTAHAVTGRRACLSVMPFLVIFNLTPAPE